MAGWLRQQATEGRVLGVALIVLLLGLRVLDPVWVADLRHTAFDTFQRVNPRPQVPQPVAIIDIDDRSLTEIGQWPWPRTVFAEIVTRVQQAGAAALAFDVIFAEADRLSPPNLAEAQRDLDPGFRALLADLPDHDAQLADALSRTPVVLGQTSVRHASRPQSVEAAPARPVPHAFIGPDPTPFLQRYPDLVQNLPELEAAAAGRGIFTVRPDPDGIYRRLPLVMEVDGVLRLGLAPELLRVATGGQPFAVRSNAAGVDGLVVAGQVIPTYRDGTVWPWFGPSLPGRFVSAVDLVEGRVPAGRLAGHLVLIGTSAIGLEDYRPTPLGVSMAGVEIHAQVLENILSGTLLSRPNYTIAVELTVVLVLGLLVVLLVPRLAARWVAVAAGAILLGWVGTSYAAFLQARLLLDPSFPALALLLLFIVMAGANYLREERARRRIRGAFGQYVSPDLVQRLTERPEDLALGGVARELTLLFTDVRGFTAISEGYKEDPEGLTTLMNQLLTTQSEAILAERGTIDKFMGDAVMAFWNAPLDHADHAQAACRAALKMRDGIAALNARRAAGPGTPPAPLNVGVGINTGLCVVGNMGSDTRFDYTALGDPVNLASRLEGQSKIYGVGIVIGAETARAVEGAFATLEIDLIRVVGKTEPVHIHALLGDEAARSAPDFLSLAQENGRMLDAFRARNWDGAEAALIRLSPLAPRFGLEGYCAIYAARLAQLRATPPAEDWDGIVDATTK
ncbi:CHASE2 domain-containing protein [Dinoroseobacter sp. S124A]|uniref:CHASE2 domain-containing protein n=1 Tax=Dinoroseobacter sp. S124A TaxID=3415128 RepID=UPI003C7EAEC8